MHFPVVPRITYASTPGGAYLRCSAKIVLMVTKQMNSFIRLASVGLIASGATLFQLASPVVAATFNFTTGPAGNQSVKSFIDSGITLTVSDSNSTGLNPLTIETASTNVGLCAYAVTTPSTPRCGYGFGLGDGISSFKLTFDKAVTLSSFAVSTFNSILMDNGTLSFSLDGINFSPTVFASTGTVPLATSLSAAANQPIYVRSSATIASGNTSGSALIRLSSLTAHEQVPAPLPLIGAAVGFGLSRKIRQRISAASLNG